MLFTGRTPTASRRRTSHSGDGPTWTPEKTPEVARIQAKHLAHIQKMVDSGDLLLAGPFLDGGELRGMFVFQVGSREEAEELANSDPAVKAGRLRVDVMTWYVKAGYLKFPKAQPAKSRSDDG